MIWMINNLTDVLYIVSGFIIFGILLNEINNEKKEKLMLKKELNDAKWKVVLLKEKCIMLTLLLYSSKNELLRMKRKV
jgi:hypothetical protein